MDIVINQDEVKTLVREYIEKKGHTIKDIEIYMRFKDGIGSGARKFSGRSTHIDLTDLDDVRQSDLLSFIDFQIVCTLDS